jgi:hypothetical protein
MDHNGGVSVHWGRVRSSREVQWLRTRFNKSE